MKTPQIEVSVCCRAKPIESFKDNPRDHHDPEPTYQCSKCKKECDVDNVCEYCLGEGEYMVDDSVYPGEPHKASVGMQKCECRLEEETEE